MANQVTTVSFVLPFASGTLDMGAIDGPLSSVLAKAQVPSSTQGQYLGRIFGEPDVVAEAVVDNGLTPVATKIFSLTADLGITFPATTFRQIKWRHWVQTENDRYVTEYERWLLGGTTPVLLGDRRIIHSCGIVAGTSSAYGLCRVHGTTSGGTVTAGTETSAGWSLGNFSSGAATLTLPLTRSLVRVLGQHFAEDAGAIGDFRDLQVRGLTALTTTATVEVATVNGTEAVTSPNGTNNYDMSFIALPPGDADLVMNSNAVEMQVTGIASDETRHRVEMFIGRAILVPFQGS